MDWFERMYEADSCGAKDEALDVLMDHIDQMFLDGEFERADREIAAIDLMKLSTTLLVGILCLAHAAKSELRSWPELVSRIEMRLTELAPDRVERLMHGLR